MCVFEAPYRFTFNWIKNSMTLNGLIEIRIVKKKILASDLEKITLDLRTFNTMFRMPEFDTCLDLYFCLY